MVKFLLGFLKYQIKKAEAKKLLPVYIHLLVQTSLTFLRTLILTSKKGNDFL